MWVVADYEATALFSLKPATATASGGKTLLIPTPFAVKMGLVDIICRTERRDVAEAVWDDWLSIARVALRPAPEVVVNNTFIKILRPPKSPKAGEPFQQTIAYREYAHLAGSFGIAVETPDTEQGERLQGWLLCLNYLGKRGGFVQALDLPDIVEDDQPPDGFIPIGSLPDRYDLNAIMTQLDDVAEDVSFEQIDIYNKQKQLNLGKHRILHHTILPYRLVDSSRGYSHYQLVEE